MCENVFSEYLIIYVRVFWDVMPRCIGSVIEKKTLSAPLFFVSE